MKRRAATWKTYAINLLLACGVMYYALKLSASGRGAIDWIILSLIAAAILWNVFQIVRHVRSPGAGDAP